MIKFVARAAPVPVSNARASSLVAPNQPDGGPDCERLIAFRVPGAIGINYKRGKWHHLVTALETTGRFVVLTFVDGPESGKQFVSFAQPLLICD